MIIDKKASFEKRERDNPSNSLQTRLSDEKKENERLVNLYKKVFAINEKDETKTETIGWLERK